MKLVIIKHCLHLDGIDGKQARRTNSSTPLGELFDHGLVWHLSFVASFCPWWFQLFLLSGFLDIFFHSCSALLCFWQGGAHHFPASSVFLSCYRPHHVFVFALGKVQHGHPIPAVGLWRLTALCNDHLFNYIFWGLRVLEVYAARRSDCWCSLRATHVGRFPHH